jgi:hypothetical protein
VKGPQMRAFRLTRAEVSMRERADVGQWAPRPTLRASARPMATAASRVWPHVERRQDPANSPRRPTARGLPSWRNGSGTFGVRADA